MLGAIIGDIAGSRFEGTGYKNINFDLFNEKCTFTDDTVCTIATADWLTNMDFPKIAYSQILQSWCKKYPFRGYGSLFYKWVKSKDTIPYNSFGNGSAMRVAPIGWAFDNLTDILKYTEIASSITHNHIEGIKGAKAATTAIYLNRIGKSKENIRSHIEKEFDYNLQRTCDQIRPNYSFNSTCLGTVPEAIISFLDSNSFENAIRLAISLGGDSDTLANITGGIAEACYGIDDSLIAESLTFLDDDILEVICRFRDKFLFNSYQDRLI